MPRIAKSLDKLRAQINATYPERSKVSDGWIGDTKHAARDSDHNPNTAGIVQALDLTHDPEHGFDSWAFAELLRANRDPRIKYVISNGRIFSSTTSPWEWRKYTGSNKHAHHVHISVSDNVMLHDDDKPWTIGGIIEVSKPPVVITPGTTAAARRRMAKIIINYEVRREPDGKFGIHHPGDGSKEIGGVVSTTHPAIYAKLEALLNAGKHAELELAVEDFVVDYTKAAAGWVTHPGLEFFLRDCIYNRGPRGAAEILQDAVNVPVDGEVGPTTRRAIGATSPDALLGELRKAREAYELRKYGKHAKWAGMVNRWNKALADAKTFTPEVPQPEKPPVTPVKQGFFAAIGAAIIVILGWLSDHILEVMFVGVSIGALGLIIWRVRRDRE